MKHGVWLANGKGLSVTETVEHAVAAEEGDWDGVFRRRLDLGRLL